MAAEVGEAVEAEGPTEVVVVSIVVAPLVVVPIVVAVEEDLEEVIAVASVEAIEVAVVVVVVGEAEAVA